MRGLDADISLQANNNGEDVGNDRSGDKKVAGKQ